MPVNQKTIAKYIVELRKKQDWTQAILAEKLGTSQSAVTRMEAGQQNFSLDMLNRLGDVFKHDIVTASSGSSGMNLQVNGGKKLSGSVEVNTSKNAAVALLIASLLNKSTTLLKKVPKIEEVYRIIEVLQSIGVDAKWQKDQDVLITPPKRLKLENMDGQAARRTRSVIMLLGVLMHYRQEFDIPHAGGCKLGSRTVKPHLYGLEKFGVNVVSRNRKYEVSVRKSAAKDIVLYESGDTVTENVLMAAALTPGETVIKFASSNYMVQDLCFLLEKFGIRVDGVGTSTLTVHGVKEINKPTTYYLSEDPIEAMFFLSLAATTNSELEIKRCPIDFLELELLKLEKMNFKYKRSKTYLAKNERTKLVDIKTLTSPKLEAPIEKIAPRPYPGLNIDNLPFFVPVAAVAKGRTLIHDWVYENRAVYYTELNKLGAEIDLADTHRVYVTGPTKFVATELVAPPALRPAVIILIAMLAAPGTSILRNVYSIYRGYEDLPARLRKIGADIQNID